MVVVLQVYKFFLMMKLEIINDEGNQICEIICFDKDGKSDTGILNLKRKMKKVQKLKKFLTAKMKVL